MVMEFLEGCDLYQFRRRLRARGEGLDIEHVVFVSLGVLSGLHYAHERRGRDGKLLGIVHRDVSPQNVFLTYDGGVKLLDFGIAKADNALTSTESGVLKGKVLYMSPEQCAGKAIDRRVDIYALGVVMYQLLTGSLPHRGKNAYDTMKSIIDSPVSKPSLLNPLVTPPLERIVMTALAKDPNARYATARDMQLDLEQYASDSGVFLSNVGFSTFVESVLGPRRNTYERSSKPLPSDIHVPTAQADPEPEPAGALQQVLFEGPKAVLKRIAGIQVLSLTGTIDEGFDTSSLVNQIKGEVIVDSGDVIRITSFGIRQLIAMFTEAKPTITGLYHVRCSVPMVSQITMIRSLLGGGRILSFQVPLIDPETRTTFHAVLQGAEAAQTIRTRQIPRIGCPSNSNTAGVFDDDPEVYLNFAEDFLPEHPAHLNAALRVLDEAERRLENRDLGGEEGSTLFVRRPLREHDRWRRALQGLEGTVRIDLSEVNSTDARGVRSFVVALEASSTTSARSTSSARRWRCAPPSPAARPCAPSRPSTRSRRTGRCTSCGTERKLSLAPAEAMSASGTPIANGCNRCNGALAIVSDVAPLAAWGATGTLAHSVEPGPYPEPGPYADPHAIGPPHGHTSRLPMMTPASQLPPSQIPVSPLEPNPFPEQPEPTTLWSSSYLSQLGCLLLICVVLALAWAGSAAVFVLKLMGEDGIAP